MPNTRFTITGSLANRRNDAQQNPARLGIHGGPECPSPHRDPPSHVAQSTDANQQRHTLPQIRVSVKAFGRRPDEMDVQK
jgi:hypothetical protein